MVKKFDIAEVAVQQTRLYRKKRRQRTAIAIIVGVLVVFSLLFAWDSCKMVDSAFCKAIRGDDAATLPYLRRSVFP
jgi:hypothetical protein